MIHVIGDIIQSVGIVVTAICIKIWDKAKIADPIVAFVFCLIILITTIPLFSDCIKLLMEAVPKDIDTNKLNEELSKIDDVVEVHDLHVWALNTSNYSLTVHLKSKNPMHSLKRATRLVNTKFKILHTTIQVEDVRDSEDNKDYQCEIYH